MDQTFKTRITDLFGIRAPIIAGGLQWLSNADYVAAAVNAGIMGFITAASFASSKDLRAEIRRCADLTGGKPFGVNVSMLPKLVQGDRTQEVFDIICEEGVAFVETSGRNPQEYLPQLKEAGIKVIHKVPGVRYAKKAQSIGVDAVTVVGAECGGHPGMDMVGTMVQAAVAGKEISIPLVIGGGIGSGQQMAAALAMGADAVIVGTRFLVAEEIWAHDDYKERLLAARETDTTLLMQTLRNTVRALRNETTDTVQAIEAENPGDLEMMLPHIAGKIGKVAYETGDWSKGTLAVGQSVAFADKIEPLAAIIDRFVAEAETAYARLGGLRVAG